MLVWCKSYCWLGSGISAIYVSSAGNGASAGATVPITLFPDSECVYEELQLASDRRRGKSLSSWSLDHVSFDTNLWPIGDIAYCLVARCLSSRSFR